MTKTMTEASSAGEERDDNAQIGQTMLLLLLSLLLLLLRLRRGMEVQIFVISSRPEKTSF